MTRNGRVTAVIALCCTVAGVALTGCDEASGQASGQRRHTASGRHSNAIATTANTSNGRSGIPPNGVP